MAVHEITIGRSGTGKTYFEVYALVNQWLPFPHNRNFFTNLPLDLDAIAAFVVEQHPELVASSALQRVRLIEQRVTDGWLNEQSGPWDYFRDQDLDGGRIVLDEVHNYVHVKSTPDYIARWRKWLGELRHCGCTFEAISQYETKIHPLIRFECGMLRRLSASDDKRDPLFWIKLYDHYQLVSKLRGFYASRVWIAEYTEENGKWTRTGGGSIPLIPTYYALYNSYSAPIAGGGKGARLSPHPFARMRWSELWRWYLSRNATRIVFMSCVYACFVYLFIGGGIARIYADVMSRIAKHDHTSSPAPSKTDEADGHADHASSTTSETQPLPTASAHAAIWSPLGVFDASGKPFHEEPSHAPPAPPKPARVVERVGDGYRLVQPASRQRSAP